MKKRLFFTLLTILVLIVALGILCNLTFRRNNFEPKNVVGEVTHPYPICEDDTGQLALYIGKRLYRPLGINSRGYRGFKHLQSGIDFVLVPGGIITNDQFLTNWEQELPVEIKPFLVSVDAVIPWRKIMNRSIPEPFSLADLFDFHEAAGLKGTKSVQWRFLVHSGVSPNPFGVVELNRDSNDWFRFTVDIIDQKEDFEVTILGMDWTEMPSGMKVDEISDNNEWKEKVVKEDLTGLKIQIKILNRLETATYLLPSFYLIDANGNRLSDLTDPSIKPTSGTCIEDRLILNPNESKEFELCSSFMATDNWQAHQLEIRHDWASWRFSVDDLESAVEVCNK